MATTTMKTTAMAMKTMAMAMKTRDRGGERTRPRTRD
jgi:hypothetical protein